MAALALLALAATPAAAAEFPFCWRGANGYTMTGAIAFPDKLMGQGLVTEDDVTGFEITGYLDGTPVGRWSMDELTDETTWHLSFDPAELRFLTGGSFPGPQSQGWNANGEVSDCGKGGFGFNSGNWAQDLCIDGTWISDSSIPPATPFFASTVPVTPACGGAELLSKREPESPGTEVFR
ncbi:hypothetical protein GZA08_17000 [Pseudoroseicyclus sp. CLL3-39]|uniref:Uncharacterized protein n=1 Tax=Pseudoroseicyclus tamaricis TaxID=2705421 RepID=A0A6B2K6V3_9RHOB|nr:hypothetical protein [Pseudoroseicyclus tamaricis]